MSNVTLILTQGFLTAMRQEVTRANKDKEWSLDTVMLTNEVTGKMRDEITAPPATGVYIYGLYLEGASWSKAHGRLTESKPKVLFELMPVLHISGNILTFIRPNRRVSYFPKTRKIYGM